MVALTGQSLGLAVGKIAQIEMSESLEEHLASVGCDLGPAQHANVECVRRDGDWVA